MVGLANSEELNIREDRPGALLATKLSLPVVRPNLVVRPQLLALLDQGLHLQARLLLVAAPAGFGKTTLLRQWILQHEQSAGQEPGSNSPRFAWLSLDPEDNDPARFLAYLVAGLESAGLLSRPAHAPMDHQMEGMARVLLQSTPSPSMQAALTAVINALSQTTTPTHLGTPYGNRPSSAHTSSAPVPVVLVLDDYHTIQAAAIHQGLAFLLEHLPAHVHLAMGTRADPPLPLARLRARGQLLEVRAAELRFSQEETGVFLNQMMGLEVSPGDVGALATRTEGWIAGLHLAALAMQRCADVSGFVDSFAGSHRFIISYLTQEIFDQQPEEIQAFLMQTAILDRLCGPLCDAVTGRSHGQAILERLEQTNLFLVPLDDQGTWYRYHSLFRDLLQHRLQRSQPELLPTLHCRAGDWFAARGFSAEALSHRLAAGASYGNRPPSAHTSSAPVGVDAGSRAGAGRSQVGAPGQDPASASVPPLLEPLNQREVEILHLIAAGLTNREIAERLVLAVSTVKWYINQLYGKLNVQNRAEAIERARALSVSHPLSHPPVGDIPPQNRV